MCPCSPAHLLWTYLNFLKRRYDSLRWVIRQDLHDGHVCVVAADGLEGKISCMLTKRSTFSCRACTVNSAGGFLSQDINLTTKETVLIRNRYSLFTSRSYFPYGAIVLNDIATHWKIAHYPTSMSSGFMAPYKLWGWWPDYLELPPVKYKNDRKAFFID